MAGGKEVTDEEMMEMLRSQVGGLSWYIVDTQILLSHNYRCHTNIFGAQILLTPRFCQDLYFVNIQKLLAPKCCWHPNIIGVKWCWRPNIFDKLFSCHLTIVFIQLGEMGAAEMEALLRQGMTPQQVGANFNLWNLRHLFSPQRWASNSAFLVIAL